MVTIRARWGHPEYPALGELMEDGRSQLFWYHELERVPAREPTASRKRAGS